MNEKVSYADVWEMAHLLLLKIRLQFVQSSCAMTLIKQINIISNPSNASVSVEIPPALYSRKFFSDHGEKLIISSSITKLEEIKEFTKSIPMYADKKRIKRKQLPKPKMLSGRKVVNVMSINDIIQDVVSEFMSTSLENKKEVVGIEHQSTTK